uniref:Uncharacterized protein n=1 Tax=Ochrobactrum phage ORM_20 TaxID=2985243 RepID=A0A9N6WRZ4_9VIRU|nr:hypothetical protein ORM20_00035 [Ochrobactrum phage ORM_20]
MMELYTIRVHNCEATTEKEKYFYLHVMEGTIPESFFGFHFVFQNRVILLTFPSKELAQEYIDTKIKAVTRGNRDLTISWPKYDDRYHRDHEMQIVKLGEVW